MCDGKVAQVSSEKGRCVRDSRNAEMYGARLLQDICSPATVLFRPGKSGGRKKTIPFQHRTCQHLPMNKAAFQPILDYCERQCEATFKCE